MISVRPWGESTSNNRVTFSTYSNWIFYCRPNRKQKIEEFGIKLMAAIEKRAEEVNKVVEDAKKRGLTKKEFVDELNNTTNGNGEAEKLFKTTYYRVFDGADAFDTIVDVIKKNCSTAAKLDVVRKTYCEGLSIKL
jgi:hypothetical protein